MSKLDVINSKWRYKRDRRDKWRVLDIYGATIEGDCEDYSLTVLYHHDCGGNLFKFLFALITLRARMHYVLAKTEGGRGGHAVLEVKGKGFIDNWSKDYVSKDEMIAKHHHLFKSKYTVICVLFRLIVGKL